MVTSPVALRGSLERDEYVTRFWAETETGEAEYLAHWVIEEGEEPSFTSPGCPESYVVTLVADLSGAEVTDANVLRRAEYAVEADFASGRGCGPDESVDDFDRPYSRWWE